MKEQTNTAKSTQGKEAGLEPLQTPCGFCSESIAMDEPKCFISFSTVNSFIQLDDEAGKHTWPDLVQAQAGSYRVRNRTAGNRHSGKSKMELFRNSGTPSNITKVKWWQFTIIPTDWTDLASFGKPEKVEAKPRLAALMLWRHLQPKNTGRVFASASSVGEPGGQTVKTNPSNLDLWSA